MSLTSPESKSEKSLRLPGPLPTAGVGLGIGGRDDKKDNAGARVPRFFCVGEGYERMLGGDGRRIRVGGWNMVLCLDIHM